MADENFNLEEALKGYNLTSDEIKSVMARNKEQPFNADSLKVFITDLRVASSKEIVHKNAKDIEYDELSAAWETVKDTKEGDELYPTKQALQKKSDEYLSMVSGPLDMATAPEISQWLEINNSKDIGNIPEQNKQLEQKLNAFYKDYDAKNGLTNISSKDAQNILSISNQLNAQFKDFNPFAMDKDGKMLYPEFANSKAFYDNLNLISDQKDAKANAKTNADYRQLMAEIAMQEAITKLSVDPEFRNLSVADKQKRVISVCAGLMEEGAVSVLVADLTAKYSQNKEGKTHEQIATEAEGAFYAAAKGQKLNINAENALSASAARLQDQKNINKRIAQKTGKRSILGRIKDKKKEFEAKHPFLGGCANFLGNIGLTTAVNAATGGIGLVALGVYRASQSIKKANEERKQSGSEMGLIKYMVKNPRHLVGLASNIASAAIGGYSGMIGLDANGLIGQGFSQGWGQAVDNMGNAIGSSWDAAGDVLNKFTPGNIGETLSSAKDGLSDANITQTFGQKISNMFNSENGLVVARSIRAVGVSVANFGVDMADMMKPDNKGKRGKLFLKALGKMGLTFGALWATTPVESADATVETPSGVPHPDTPINDVATDNTPDTPVSESVASKEDLDFWNNRSDKFLGEDTKNYIYNMVDKGEIKLPEGIETKEEYAYKLAMDIQQTPAEINEALGGEWRSSAELTKDIRSWTSEDFAKLNDSVDDFNDRGDHYPPIPQTPVHTDTPRTPPVDLAQPITPDLKIQENIQEDIPQIRIPEQPRTVEYFQDQQDALKGDKGENSFKEEINLALKSDGFTVEQGIDQKIAHEIGKGDLTLQKGKELGDYVKYELDRYDNGNLDGEVQDEEVSKGDVRKAMGAIDKTLEDMEDNADNVLLAKNMEDVKFPEVNNLAESYSKDTDTSKFYKGMSSVVAEMQNSEAPINHVMKNVIGNGEISQEQATVMNTRFSELRKDGYSPNEALTEMNKEFNNSAKYWHAQELAADAKNRLAEQGIGAQTTVSASNVAEQTAEITPNATEKTATPTQTQGQTPTPKLIKPQGRV